MAFLLSPTAEARENFLVIIADDLGVDGINVYSQNDLYGHPGEGANPGPTPHIDQLAAEGILFRNAYTNPLCRSGRSALRRGWEPNGGGPYADDQQTIRDETYKLIWRNGTYEEFFNLVADPFEANNLLPVSNLSVEEEAVYDELVDTMETIFLPEPGYDVLLATGIAFLAIAGHRRLRDGARARTLRR